MKKTENIPTNEKQYLQLMADIEVHLQKATAQGGFASLAADEASKLARLSQIAEVYEDAIPLMPTPVPRSIPEMISFKM